MKDLLYIGETPYEVLGVKQSASTAEIEKAFRNGIMKRPREVQKLTTARNCLVRRPFDRAMTDILLYDADAITRLTLSPLKNPDALQPANRHSTARSWKRDLKRSFPDYGIAHSLAVLYHWWTLHEESQITELLNGGNGSLKDTTFPDLKAQLVQDSLRRQGAECNAVERQHETFADPCSRRAECPYGPCCDKPFPDLEALWQETICYWAMVLCSNEFWTEVLKVQAGVRDEIRKAFPEKLNSMFHGYGQRFHSNGTSGLAGMYEDLELTLATEIRTATIMPKAGVRTSSGTLSCGAALLTQFGLIESVRAQVEERLKKDPTNETICELHIALSPYFSIYLQIENRQYRAALEAIEALPSGQANCKEVRSLYVTAIEAVGKQNESVGKYAEALDCWRKGIEADPKGESAGRMKSAIISMSHTRATAMQDSRRPEAIALLEKALKLVNDKSLTELLAELLTSESISIHNTCLDKEQSGEPVTEELVKQYQRAVELAERAAALGSERARDFLETLRSTVRLKAGILSLPGSVRELVLQAVRARQNGNLDEAISKYDEALGLINNGRMAPFVKELASCLCNRGIARINEALDSRKAAIDKLNAAFADLEVKARLSPSYLGFAGKCVKCGCTIYGPYFTFNLPNGGTATVCGPHGEELNALVRASNALSPRAAGLARDGFADIAEASELDRSDEHIQKQLKEGREILQRFSVAVFDPKVRRQEKLALLIVGGILTSLGILIGLGTGSIGWTIFLALVGLPMLIGGRFYRTGCRKGRKPRAAKQTNSAPPAAPKAQSKPAPQPVAKPVAKPVGSSATHKPAKNDLCPCGSGKKYKLCCGTKGAGQSSERTDGSGGSSSVYVKDEASRVACRETIQTSAKAQGKHKKLGGGRGEYADCWIEVEPLGRGQGFQFVDNTVGGVIPKQYMGSVEKGIRDAMQHGILAGYPVVDIKATVYDGSFHPVDSSEAAFRIAASLAFRNAMTSASPVLLEPIMEVLAVVPDACAKDVIRNLEARRGRVVTTTAVENGNVSVTAAVPQVEMSTLETDIRSLTGGKGRFTARASGYDEMPSQMAQRIIERNKAESGGASPGKVKPASGEGPNAGRIPCKQCGNMILGTTAQKTGGLCMPCAKGAPDRTACPKCGKQQFARFILGGKAVHKCTVCGHKDY